MLRTQCTEKEIFNYPVTTSTHFTIFFSFLVNLHFSHIWYFLCQMTFYQLEPCEMANI